MKLHFLHQLCKWFSYKLKKVKLTTYSKKLTIDKNLIDWGIPLNYTFFRKYFLNEWILFKTLNIRKVINIWKVGIYAQLMWMFILAPVFQYLL